MRHIMGNGATLDTLMRRVTYGGRKGRRAARRLDGLVLGLRGYGTLSFRIIRGSLVSTCCGESTYALAAPSEGEEKET